MPLAAAPTAPTDLAWRVIGLVNLYRLLIPPALFGLFRGLNCCCVNPFI